jgi:hypothetical protein
MSILGDFTMKKRIAFFLLMIGSELASKIVDSDIQKVEHESTPIKTFKIAMRTGTLYPGLYGGLNEIHVLEHNNKPFGTYEANNQRALYTHSQNRDKNLLRNDAQVSFHYESPRRSGEDSWTKPKLRIKISTIHEDIIDSYMVPEVSQDGQEMQIKANFEHAYVDSPHNQRSTIFEATYPTHSACKKRFSLNNESSIEAMDQVMRTPSKLVLPQFTNVTTDERDPQKPSPRPDWQQYHCSKTRFWELGEISKRRRIEELREEARNRGKNSNGSD